VALKFQSRFIISQKRKRRRNNMEEKKMTDEEIAKALMACSNMGCSNVVDCCDNSCPLFEVDWCVAIMGKHAIDLIRRLQSENEQLRNAKTIYESVDYCADDLAKALKTISEQKAEIEKLLCKNAELEVRCEGILKDYYAECQTCDEQKDEIERLKEKSISHYRDSWKNKFFKAQETIERLTEELEKTKDNRNG
jgi:hypothetical protein